MNRRGFLGRAGAVGAAAFVPFVVEESKAAPPTTLPAAPPPAPPDPEPATGEVVRVTPGRTYLFRSRYANLRVQVAMNRAVQFRYGVFRTDDAAVANALIAASMRRRSPYAELWEPVPSAERDPVLTAQIERRV